MHYFKVLLLFILTFMIMIMSVHGENGSSYTQAVEYIFNKKTYSRISCTSEEGIPYLVYMLETIISRHMTSEVLVILYDDFFYYSSIFQIILDNLLKLSKASVRLGRLNTNLAKPQTPDGFLQIHNFERSAFIIFAKDIDAGGEVLIDHATSDTKVILISQSSTYQIKQYLSSKNAQHIVNLLVVVDLTLKVDLFTQHKRSKTGECDIMIYSHKLFANPVGSSHPVIVTAWRRSGFTRENVTLFPDKFKDGLNSLHLIISASDKPPFVFRKRDQKTSEHYLITSWEGLEVRLIKLLSNIMNFTVEFKEPISVFSEEKDSTDIVLGELSENKVDLALGGIYMSSMRNQKYSFMFPHTQDCAAFISLTSTALPKYRAIMGPFLWDVWLALSLTYLLAMVPISFSVWHSFKPVVGNIKELENMFWYVFGTFTNCFSFNGPNSWSKGDKNSTKLFIGTYWIFTIIITACYTGSIIAFITLPVFPEAIENVKQLVEKNFKLSTIKTGVWYSLVNETSDPLTLQLLPDMDLVSDYVNGLKNVTGNSHSDRKSVFLGSRHLLEYVVRVNYTPSDSNKPFHISKECFVPLMVSIAFPPKTLFMEHLNVALQRLNQAGFFIKITRDVHWIIYKGSAGKLLQIRNMDLRAAPVEDRQLTLDDTQGMFLLLGAGFAIAVATLFGEIMVWVWKESRAPAYFGKSTIGERISEKTGRWLSVLKRCLFAPVDLPTTPNRIIQERSESKISHQISELFGSEVSLNLNIQQARYSSDTNLQPPKIEPVIRLKSF